MRGRASKFFIRKVIPIVGFLIMAWTLFSLSKVVWKNYQSEKETKLLKEETELLQEENQQLRNLIAYYKTDAYREKEARLRLGYKKPGEQVVLVPNVEEREVEYITDDSNTNKKNYQLWLDLFFKKKD